MVFSVKLVVLGLWLYLPKSHYGQTIVLTSSLETEERYSVCVGEIVVFTCKVMGAGILKWGIDPYVDIDHNPIRFRLRDYLKVGYRVNGTDGLYNVTVISVSPDPNIRLLGNLTSELSVLAVPGQRVQVQCDDGTTGRQTADMSPADPPSVPQNLSFSIETCGISNYSVRLQWEAPSEQRVKISNYTITVTVPELTIEPVEVFQANQHSIYNTFISLQLCIQIGCGRPFPPVNGIIEPYSSTQEGAEIQYHCEEGHTPTEWITSQCQENGMWAPNPLLICAIVNCGSPNITLNGSVTFTTTTYNSSATYMCRSGLVPSDVYSTFCTSKGEWEPDPSTLECGEPADCGIPESPSNGDFHYSSTIEGSKMNITCNEGFSLQANEVEFVCTNGSWSPDPGDEYCLKMEQEPESGVVVAVLVAVTGGVLLCIAVTIICIVVWRKRSRLQSKSFETNAQIQLKSNEAYGEVMGK